MIKRLVQNLIATFRIYGQFSHAKGMLAFDGNSGFWIIHSQPYWSNFNCGSFAHSLDPTEMCHCYAQNFIRVSFDTIANFNAIAEQWRCCFALFFTVFH